MVGAWDVRPTSGTLILEMARREWIPFYPVGGKCFINAEDCAAAIVQALRRGVSCRRYLLGNDNLSYREFMTLVAEVIGKRPPALPIPRLATTAMSSLARVLPRRLAPDVPSLLAAMQVERFRSGRRAREELGMPRTPLTRGIDAAWRWFAAHGYLTR